MKHNTKYPKTWHETSDTAVVHSVNRTKLFCLLNRRIVGSPTFVWTSIPQQSSHLSSTTLNVMREEAAMPLTAQRLASRQAYPCWISQLFMSDACVRGSWSKLAGPIDISRKIVDPRWRLKYTVVNTHSRRAKVHLSGPETIQAIV